MTPHIAIPSPTSKDGQYNLRNWQAYADAVRGAGGEPVEIKLGWSPSSIAECIQRCEAILLPGSPADVNAAKYGHAVDAVSSAADAARENADELLLQDAHNLYKPLLGICFGAQMLNVWRSGTLVQDLTVMPVNHAATQAVLVAHTVAIAPDSLLAKIIDKEEAAWTDGWLRLPVNSSHHQAVGITGDGIHVSARCPQDYVVEAIEGGQGESARLIGADPRHFVLGVQWHPERTINNSASSRSLFEHLVEEARMWSPRAKQVEI